MISLQLVYLELMFLSVAQTILPPCDKNSLTKRANEIEDANINMGYKFSELLINLESFLSFYNKKNAQDVEKKIWPIMNSSNHTEIISSKALEILIKHVCYSGMFHGIFNDIDLLLEKAFNTEIPKTQKIYLNKAESEIKAHQKNFDLLNGKIICINEFYKNNLDALLSSEDKNVIMNAIFHTVNRSYVNIESISSPYEAEELNFLNNDYFDDEGFIRILPIRKNTSIYGSRIFCKSFKTFC